MNTTLGCLLAPPFIALRYSCGSSCAAPVTVLWIASVFFVALGVLGGPTTQQETSWPTIMIGMLLWAISAAWTWLATRNQKSCSVNKKQPTDIKN